MNARRSAAEWQLARGRSENLRDSSRNISAPLLGSFPFSFWNFVQIWSSSSQTAEAMQPQSSAETSWRDRDGANATSDTRAGGVDIRRVEGNAGRGAGAEGAQWAARQSAEPATAPSKNMRSIAAPGPSARSIHSGVLSSTTGAFDRAVFGMIRPVTTTKCSGTAAARNAQGVPLGPEKIERGAFSPNDTPKLDAEERAEANRREIENRDIAAEEISSGVEGDRAVERRGGSCYAQGHRLGAGGSGAEVESVSPPSQSYPAGSGQYFEDGEGQHHQECSQERELFRREHQLGLGGTQPCSMFDDEDGDSSGRLSPLWTTGGR